MLWREPCSVLMSLMLTWNKHGIIYGRGSFKQGRRVMMMTDALVLLCAQPPKKGLQGTIINTKRPETRSRCWPVPNLTILTFVPGLSDERGHKMWHKRSCRSGPCTALSNIKSRINVLLLFLPQTQTDVDSLHAVWSFSERLLGRAAARNVSLSHRITSLRALNNSLINQLMDCHEINLQLFW